MHTHGLETYTEFRRGIDELELNLLEIPTRRVDHEGFADGDDTLLGSRDRALEHQKVVLDDTGRRDATHGCDRLFGDIGIGGRVSVVGTRANTVNLLVELGTVMVTVCSMLLEQYLRETTGKQTHFDQHERLRT